MHFPRREDAHVEPVDFVLIPDALANGGSADRHEGRLHPDLLAVAGDPEAALQAAIIRATASRHDFARASAELAITGRRAWTRFQALDPAASPDDLPQRIARSQPVIAAGVEASAALALARKYVAWARTTSTWLRAQTRAARDAAFDLLHPVPLSGSQHRRPWVAVSGELDPPDRPVNMGRHPFNQRDVTVMLKGQSIRVRVAWSPNVVDLATKTILFIHGLGSCLEETQSVCAELQAKGYGFISLDLPNQGYSDRFAFDAAGLGDMTTTGTRVENGGKYAYTTRAMTFYLEFLEAFIKQIPTEFPGAAPMLAAVGGGSQGGCLTLGLALRQAAQTLKDKKKKTPKLAERFLPWSVGSSWRSFLDGDDAHAAALANSPLRSALLEENMPDLIGVDARYHYIDGMFDVPIPVVNKVQPELWFSKAWAGRENATNGSRALRWEVYDEWHRRWCSAMAHEQLVYSFAIPGPELDVDAAPDRWPLDLLRDPVLLMAGQMDDYKFTNICTATKLIAQRASRPELGKLAWPHGVHVTFPDSGHSLADERPVELAEEIDNFLRTPEADLR